MALPASVNCRFRARKFPVQLRCSFGAHLTVADRALRLIAQALRPFPELQQETIGLS